jgi:hypothetical protein
VLFGVRPDITTTWLFTLSNPGEELVLGDDDWPYTTILFVVGTSVSHVITAALPIFVGVATMFEIENGGIRSTKLAVTATF